MTDLTNLIDIDSDSDIENPTEHNEFFDKLTLDSFPDPYNTIGQFIMTAISGASISHLIKLNENKPATYVADIEIYFQYCKNSHDDNYINDLISRLTIDKSKLNITMDKIKDITIDIMARFIDSNIEIFNKHRSKSDNEFNMDLFNADILKNLIPLIKYSLISNIISK